MTIRKLFQMALLTFLSASAGCKEGGPGTSGYLARPGPEQMRIAVLPFDSASLQFENAGQVVSQEVVTELMGTGVFEVVDPGAVYQAMVDAGLRNGNGYGLGPDGLQKLQDRIGPVRLFVVGIVQEFGEVRVGPATYPAISLNARLLDGETGSILWSGSVSRTGADSEKFFGLGAVHSVGRLARAAVRDLIGSLNRRELAHILRASEPRVAKASARVASVSPSPSRRSRSERYFNESATYSESELKALLVEVPGVRRSPVEYRLHHYSIAEAAYSGDRFEIRTKLIDYLAAQPALEFVKHNHQREVEGEFVGLPAYAGPSPAQNPGGYHLDIAVGRFGLFLEGPSDRQSSVEQVARAIIHGMK